MKTALALQPPAIPAPRPWHICMGTPRSVPTSHWGGPKTPPLWGKPCASLVAPGQSCWRWQADDNEISNTSTISFSETDLTTLSPTRTLVKVNPLFGAGESLADAAPAAGPGSPQTLGGIGRGLRCSPILGRCCGRLLPKPHGTGPPQCPQPDPNLHPGGSCPGSRARKGLGLPVLGSSQSTGTGRELQCSCFQNTSRLPPPKHFSIYGPAAGSQGDECAGL